MNSFNKHLLSALCKDDKNFHTPKILKLQKEPSFWYPLTSLTCSMHHLMVLFFFFFFFQKYAYMLAYIKRVEETLIFAFFILNPVFNVTWFVSGFKVRCL